MGVAPANAQYAIDYLISPYKPGVVDSWLFGINNKGQSTGYTFQKDSSGVYVKTNVIYRNGDVKTLATTNGYFSSNVGLAINDRGDVVGNYQNNPTFFSASGGQTTIDIPNFYVIARGINNSGNVLIDEYPNDPTDVSERFGLWNTSSYRALSELDALFPNTPPPDPNDFNSGISSSANAYGITNLGPGNQFAAGVRLFTYDPHGPNDPDDDTYVDEFVHAFVYDGQGGYKFLNPQTAGDNISPININSDGSVFGWEGDRLGIWGADGSLSSILPTFAGGINLNGYGGYSSVRRNNLGQVVAVTNAGGVALYNPTLGSWSDITSTISGLGTGTFSTIQDFNDVGQFVGLVRPPGGGGVFGYVVSTVPEPGAIALLSTGALSGGMIWLRRRKPGSNSK